MTLVDSARQVAKQAKEILTQQNLLTAKKSNRKNNLQCYVSDEPENFAKQGKRFLGFELNKVRKVNNV